MHSRRNENALFGKGLLRLWVLVLRRDGEEFALIPCQSPAQGVSVEEVLRIGVFLYTQNVIVKV
jgi:hypothetical protein